MQIFYTEVVGTTVHNRLSLKSQHKHEEESETLLTFLGRRDLGGGGLLHLKTHGRIFSDIYRYSWVENNQRKYWMIMQKCLHFSLRIFFVVSCAYNVFEFVLSENNAVQFLSFFILGWKWTSPCRNPIWTQRIFLPQISLTLDTTYCRTCFRQMIFFLGRLRFAKRV
jgi:hypothetical protein